MTQKEINAMTDEELRVKADELLHPGNRINFFCDKLARFYPGDYEEYDWVPDYPNDIAAARGLVDLVFADNNADQMEYHEFYLDNSHLIHVGAKPFLEHSLAERYIQALCEVVDVRPLGLAYSDFGSVSYGDLSKLIYAHPNTITKAFILASTG